MKKLTSILILVSILLPLCFGCSNSNNDVYIGEGKMTVIRSLISTNGLIANEVFGANHLPVDASQTITQNSRIYAPVVSDKISTYAELESVVKSTYTEEVANRLLSEPEKYIEIDGKLYFDLHYDIKNEAEYDWSDFEIKLKKINDDGSYLFKVNLKKTNGFKSSIKISVSDTNGTLRLCEFYN